MIAWRWWGVAAARIATSPSFHPPPDRVGEHIKFG